ncbi:MAG: crotonase/enoyl-CoA hydratase family protein [Deltaproteobacteria bacterium]|nr:crotonase/enoyl-CoA hydratase family protein [Deltaproteobacteria bacterium]MBT4642813.1 crotonase/enoyl-CoA hydratase family protein [Deltaproteobacteria bacterium]MBT6499314.1 crotonase/enoyl-CoA hydratase family protein [Deltaproteobacteria bacterium]MBT6613436.1 crotonase/enoyl-CoA hydratase family protein [Deltaproteobacteria bacterium]MBT7155611.1 crotonase/enoyl-CoA hydratase family protein [Deltaproteobacteria bacterium]
MALIFEKRNNIAYITLNRPESRNAFDPEMLVELAAVWKEYREDKSLRCAILTGAGDKAFCAGADLGILIPLMSGARKAESEADKQVQNNPEMMNQAILRDFDLHKPVVAAINGHAIAGGLEFLYATDIRIACPEAKFGLQEVKWAIFPMGGSSVHLPRQLPYAKAMEMLLTGELISAQEALDFGLINRIVPRDQVVVEAEKTATLIAKNGPLAVLAIKKAVQANLGVPVKEALAKELEIAMPVFLSKDVQEGPRAFKEKREPVYKGE